MSSSAAEEFEKLAQAATPGPWTPEVLGDEDYSITSARGWLMMPESFEDAKFVMWCANNRALIARALRLAAIVENPSDADLAAVGCGVPFVRVDENLNETRHSVYNPLADPRAILAALRERADEIDPKA